MDQETRETIERAVQARFATALTRDLDSHRRYLQLLVGLTALALSVCTGFGTYFFGKSVNSIQSLAGANIDSEVAKHKAELKRLEVEAESFLAGLERDMVVKGEVLLSE